MTNLQILLKLTKVVGQKTILLFRVGMIDRSVFNDMMFKVTTTIALLDNPFILESPLGNKLFPSDSQLFVHIEDINNHLSDGLRILVRDAGDKMPPQLADQINVLLTDNLVELPTSPEQELTEHSATIGSA